MAPLFDVWDVREPFEQLQYFGNTEICCLTWCHACLVVCMHVTVWWLRRIRVPDFLVGDAMEGHKALELCPRNQAGRTVNQFQTRRRSLFGALNIALTCTPPSPSYVSGDLGTRPVNINTYPSYHFDSSCQASHGARYGTS